MARLKSHAKMMSKSACRSTYFNEMLQQHKYEYLQETGQSLATTMELAVWAIRTGRWEPPRDLALRKCREDYAKALREEYVRGADGLPVRVNQAARRTVGDKQITFWADIRTAPRDHVDAARQQRREQIVGECRQLDRDERFYNGLHPDESPMQTEFDFRDAVVEGRFSGEYMSNKPR